MLRKDLAVAEVEYKTNDGYLDLHATRHTGITRGSRVMTVFDLKAYSRHAKIETTMRYVHTDKQELREGVDKLPAIGGKNGAPTTDTNGAGNAPKKSVHKCVRASGSTSQCASSRRSNGHSTENDATPCL